MEIITDRLKIVPLTAKQLRQWIEDLPALEEKMNITYVGEPVEGHLMEILKGQVVITEKDPENYVWHSFWLIIRKSDSTVVGSADFKNMPSINGEVEIGYGLGKMFEKHGYMTETVKAMCEWALKQKGVSFVIAETETDNFASQHVLQRCGFTEYRREKTIWWRLQAHSAEELCSAT